MGYGNNHYNYQIAVIFAILIGAVLLLLLVLLGIWFITKSLAPSPMNVQTTMPYNQPSPYQQNQQYSQVPLVTPVNQDYINQTRTTQLQPDVIYTQGPTGFTRSTPVEFSTYHQSSV